MNNCKSIITTELVGMKISDERKVDPQPVVVTQEVPFEMAVPHKVSFKERLSEEEQMSECIVGGGERRGRGG